MTLRTCKLPNMSCQVTFKPAGMSGLVAKGTRVSDAAERLGVPVRLECGGKGECTSCRVVVDTGLENLSWPTESEFALLPDADRGSGARLACQATVNGDCEVSIPLVSAAAGEKPGEDSTEREPSASGARDALRDAFESLPPAERASAVLEMQLKVAGDVLNAIVETPIKVGEQIVDSIFGPGSWSGRKEGSPGESEPAGDGERAESHKEGDPDGEQ